MEDYDYFLDILMEDNNMIMSKAKLICQEMCDIVDKNKNKDYKMFWLKSNKFQIGIKPRDNPKNIIESQIITNDKDVVTIGFLF